MDVSEALDLVTLAERAAETGFQARGRLRPLPEGSDVHPHILSSHPEVLYQAIVQPARTPLT